MPDTTDFGTTQHYAKAYPGLRILQVLQAVGHNTLVASVCPKITDPALIGDPSYGYNPIMKALSELTDANLVQ